MLPSLAMSSLVSAYIIRAAFLNKFHLNALILPEKAVIGVSVMPIRCDQHTDAKHNSENRRPNARAPVITIIADMSWLPTACCASVVSSWIKPRVENCWHRQGGAEYYANVTLGMQVEREHAVDEEYKEPDALVTAHYCLRLAGNLMDQTCYETFALRYDEFSFYSATTITPTSNLTHLTIQLLMGLGGGKKIFRTLRGILLKLTPSQLPTILLPQSTKTVPPSTSLPSGCMRT